jgi:hypothetical protein
MKFQKLNEKLRKVKSVLSIFKLDDGDGNSSRVCDENTWMILEIEVNCERTIQVLNPRATKVVHDRLVEYGKTHEKISFYGFNRYIMEIGDPAYFSSDLNLVVVQDDEVESFAKNIDRDKLDAEMDEMLRINPDDPELEGCWGMENEVE